METKSTDKKTRRGIYLLPNLFTTAGLFAGFYAIVAAMKGLFDVAAIAIFIAMIADGIDGRVARLTNTDTDFGAEYDSLADMVAFGLAPALVVYSWSLSGLGKLGWLAAFCYAAATGLRLARFNAQLDNVDQDKRYFYGLPCPSGAALIASMVWLAHNLSISGMAINIFAAIITVLAAALMVSNIPYHSFKKLDFKGKVPFFALLLLVLIFVGIALDPPLILFITFYAFALSGPVLWFWRWRKNRRAAV